MEPEPERRAPLLSPAYFPLPPEMPLPAVHSKDITHEERRGCEILPLEAQGWLKAQMALFYHS